MKTRFAILLLCVAIVSCGKKFEETKPIRKDVTETVFASGYLEAEGTYELTALSDGYLTEVNFEEGDLVKKGQVLAVIDNKENLFNTQSATQLYRIARENTTSSAPLLLQAKQNAELARQKMEQNAQQEQRYRKLLETNSISKVEYENVYLDYQTSRTNYLSALESYRNQQQQARQNEITNRANKQISAETLGNNRITAVSDGKVYQKLKVAGDYVKRGDVIATIGSADIIYAKVNVDEANIAKIKTGQKAYLQLNAEKNKVYNGTVDKIYPSFDEETQSFVCRIIFTEPVDFKVAQTQLQSNIVVARHDNALLIPRSYIDYNGYVQIKGRDEKTKVKTNFVSNEWVQVLEGINDSTTLVTDQLSANKMKTSEVGAQLGK
ncbi:hypothetical protein CHU92_07095 [Flavobacterium cyanobacteriorum]|uniref:Uncharacterized protein n=1 Tax=Flavobacterium cyanobacteriorum TaxID=2022802 RepID=A0A255Z978_9FLAO|nr:HlyD family efflux transporter periplasmic adaptor subunit [Flavobacterium cyanobacteriorum]OYQ37982.1 hypothetical protein CHU92_07095 [Flavobacterium cyanobacteriorum]